MDKLKSAIILAGGKSRRMEFDKQLLMREERRLIFHIAKNLENYFSDIIIVTNKQEYYKNCKYKIVSDKIKNVGPLAGISVGLEHSESEYVYIVACDMPNIDFRYIDYMNEKISRDIDNKNNFDIYLSQIDNRIELFHGYYKKSLSNEIYDYLINGTRKSIISFFEKNNKSVSYTDEVEFIKNGLDRNIFINLNTKEDLYLYNKENKTLWI